MFVKLLISLEQCLVFIKRIFYILYYLFNHLSLPVVQLTVHSYYVCSMHNILVNSAAVYLLQSFTGIRICRVFSKERNCSLFFILQFASKLVPLLSRIIYRMLLGFRKPGLEKSCVVFCVISPSATETWEIYQRWPTKASLIFCLNCARIILECHLLSDSVGSSLALIVYNQVYTRYSIYIS